MNTNSNNNNTYRRPQKTIADLFDQMRVEEPQTYNPAYRATSIAPAVQNAPASRPSDHQKRQRIPLFDNPDDNDDDEDREDINEGMPEDEFDVQPPAQARGIDIPQVRFDVKDADVVDDIAGNPWRKITIEERDFVRYHASIMDLEPYLEGIRQCVPPVPLVTIFLIRSLRHMGLLSCHISNELVTISDKKTQYVFVLCIIQRLERAHDPDMCLLLHLVVRPCVEEAKDLGEAYIKRPPVDMAHSTIDAAAAGKLYSAPSSSKKTAEPDDVLEQYRAVREEMTRQLIMPAILVNYTFELARIADHQEKYSLHI